MLLEPMVIFIHRKEAKMLRLKASLQIFVVEDDEEDILIFCETCKDVGLLNVHCFHNIKDLVRYAHSNGTTAEVILLDVGRVAFEWPEMFETMASDPLLRTVPIIFVSGSEPLKEVLNKRYPHLKIDRFLTKPITIQGLSMMLQPFTHLFEN
jgi:CheY-like chemotaxis protein